MCQNSQNLSCIRLNGGNFMLTSMINTIEFGKLGIGPFELNRVAFTIFGLDIYWYAVIITGGMILAILFCIWQAKNVGLTADNILDISIIGIPVSVIGARFFYVIFSLDKYDSFGAMIDIRDGGMAIYGAVIAAFIAGYFYCRHKKVDTLALFDLGAMGFLIGQAVGRWGNFVNAEAHGGVTDSVFGMSINGAGPYHPTFLYESVWNVIGFLMIFLFFKYLKKHNGEIVSLYFFWYGVGRFIIEEMRTDSLWLGEIKINRWLGIFFAVIGLLFFIFIRFELFGKIFKSKKKNKDYKELYKPLLDNKDEKSEGEIESEIVEYFNENKEQLLNGENGELKNEIDEENKEDIQ